MKPGRETRLAGGKARYFDGFTQAEADSYFPGEGFSMAGATKKTIDLNEVHAAFIAEDAAAKDAKVDK